MQKQDKFCVIMAGGVGSRFWPISTDDFPKQFQDILGVGRTMIQQTYDRINRLVSAENIFVITNREYRGEVGRQLPQLNPGNIIGEPQMKNTAPCNLYMAQKIKNLNPEAVIAVLPSDHLILKEEAFLQKMEEAFEVAQQKDTLVTIGIQPTRPETGYGYIHYEERKESEVLAVQSFTEKPTLEIAQRFLAEGNYLWNAGIFVWSATHILESFGCYLPEMAAAFESVQYNSASETSGIEEVYAQVDRISIDKGILEKAENVSVIPADLGWSDLGTWASIFEHAPKDEKNNALNSKNVLLYNSAGNMIHTENPQKVVVVDGVENFIIVDTAEALLICPRERDQEIRHIAERAKQLQAKK